MKELSIEQKAKAYDEALKVLHKYDGANIITYYYKMLIRKHKLINIFYYKIFGGFIFSL